jgi:hypothetical protein
MAFVDTLLSLISYLTIGIQGPKPRSQKSIKKKASDSEINDTSDLWLETQRVSSGLLKILKVKSLQDKKKQIIDKVKTRYTRINKTVHQAEFMKTRDKFVFMATCMNVGFGSFLLGKFPCYFYYFYMFYALTLIPLRFINYRLQNWHYFMLDFCYYANMTTITYLYVYPESELLFNVASAFCFGPFLVAVPLFTNSFVPHSIDKITSLVIHILPGLALWGVQAGECPGFNVKVYSLTDFYLYASGSYFIWLFFYYLIIFGLTYERCIRKGNLTMYRYAMEDHTTLTYKYCGLLGERFRPLMFLSQHALSNLVLFCIAFVLISNFWALSLSMVFVISWSAWNGATYYIDLFARRYEKDIMKIQEIYSNIDK